MNNKSKTQLFPILGEALFPTQMAGKKAAHLHTLKTAGFDVPLGFVLTDASFADRALSNESLSLSLAAIGGFPVAVRSSGVLEDLAGASFAGQYTTILEVNSMEALLSAIRICRDASTQENVRAYAQSRGITGEIPAPSLLIQKMVAAQKAGVAFGIHPVTGKEEHVYIELCAGLGEKLVSGTSNPTRLTLSHAHEGKIIEEELGEDAVSLTFTERAELVETLLKISAHFGSPQDVEWAIDQNGTLRILQSRPITRVQWRTDTEEMTNADLKDGGVSARVCTPMMFSLYRRCFQNSMQKYFENVRFLKKGDRKEWMHSFYGRVYWNAGATKQGLFKIPGFDESSFDRDLGIQKDYGPGGPIRISSTSPRVLIGAIPIALGIEAEFKSCVRMTQVFVQKFPEKDAHYRKALSTAGQLTHPEFAQLFGEIVDGFYPWTEESYFTTIYNNSNAQTLFKDLIAKIDRKTSGETRLVHLLSGLSDVSHLEMQRGILELHRVGRTTGVQSSEFESALQQFLMKNDFHSDAELELMTPRWGEAPERVRQMIQDMIASGITPTDPDASTQRQRIEFKNEVEAVHTRIRTSSLSWVSKLSLKHSFDSQLARVRDFLTRREALRELSSRAYYLVRLAILEGARRLKESGEISEEMDLFYLHWDEANDALLGVLNGETLKKLIQKRKTLTLAYRNFTPPNEFGAGISQFSAASLISEENGSIILKGTGCSPGVFEGPVKVIASVSDMGRIQEGDILVTQFTDPGWTPVLGLVRGIVTEVGGMLSHAAVISREYGIPAVLNLPGAMKELEGAKRIRIDGNSGRITILEHQESHPA